MAEIIELIAADHLHIMRWQVQLADLRRHRGEPGCAPELAATWDTLAALIDLHMAAEDTDMHKYWFPCERRGATATTRRGSLKPAPSGPSPVRSRAPSG